MLGAFVSRLQQSASPRLWYGLGVNLTMWAGLVVTSAVLAWALSTAHHSGFLKRYAGNSANFAVPPSEFVSVAHAERPLWVSKTETTVLQWQACVADGACPALSLDNRNSNSPITGVNWQDVSSYLKWYTRKFQVAVRLPTRGEWLAFAGEHAPGHKVKLFDDPRLAWAADYDLTAVPESVEPEPSGSFGVNQYGIADLKGNVWEWTATCQIDVPGLSPNQQNCVSGRYAMGDHGAIVSDRLRDPGNAGCGGGQPPQNVGIRLVFGA